MTDLTAIDILVEPDATALARAAAENARLRARAPEGFTLDDNHQPHVTLLQRFVRTAELEAVFFTVERAIRARGFGGLSFRAVGIRHMPVAALPGMGIAAIVLTPAPSVLELQQSLIEAVGAFTATGGTTAAFATTPQDPDVNADTLAYVERYVPTHSGTNFLAHVTVGLAPLSFLEKIETSPFDEFTFRPSGIAVFKLGNNGTARKRLRSWPDPA